MRQTSWTIVVTFVHALVCFAGDAHVDSGQLVLALEVINGTTNGHPVVGDNVTVAIYEHNKLVNSLESKVATDGTVVFENIQAGEHTVAVATVFHKGMSFSSNEIVLKAGQERVNAQVQVFDVSYDTSGLSAKTHHLILKRQDNSVSLTEYIQLVNPSDMAISSRQRDDAGKTMVLIIPLPKGFKNFTSSGFLVPQALGFTENGFYDTMGVPPGAHELIFSYTLDIKSDTMDITKKISLPTANFVLFSQLSHEKIQGLGNVESEVVMSDGTLAQYYVLDDLPAGRKVKFNIAGLSTSVGNKSSWIILAVVFGVIIFVAVLRLRHSENHSVSA